MTNKMTKLIDDCVAQRVLRRLDQQVDRRVDRRFQRVREYVHKRVWAQTHMLVYEYLWGVK